MGPVTFPEPDDNEIDFISWMRNEWKDRTGSSDEAEFWAFVKTTTNLAMNWSDYEDDDSIF